MLDLRRAAAGVACFAGTLSAASVLEAQHIDTVRLAEVRVIGTPAALSRIPGSATLVGRDALQVWRVVTINDVLRQVPGITVREEEGLGLRPNIGVRGLNPTRSTKVLLLEDGIPITFAPYGDNASYYHPPVTRFDRVEVVRGSGQIAFGPQTVGGVINYLTPSIPHTLSGRGTVTGGGHSFLDVAARAGGSLGSIGALGAFNRRQADGARDNVGTEMNDVMLKATSSLSEHNTLTVRGNFYRERSNVTYSGLTEAEWALDARANPFRNDSMKLDRWGASATHAWTPSTTVQLITTFYASDVVRHWWRQSSNSSQRPNDASDPMCAGMANLNSTCGNEGRLRAYTHYGVEPRLRAQHSLFGLAGELEAGVRWHTEEQDRRQVNGASPAAREAVAGNRNAGLVEHNLRANRAWSGFAQERVAVNDFTFTPGVRVEHISYERTNLLNDASGTAQLTKVIPGAGLTYALSPSLMFFSGVHRGFAPPRTEDIINNNTGGTVELDAELSWNYEAGMRGAAGPIDLELTIFRLDFENQIVPASVAGGTGAALTNSGHTLHQGLELGGRLDGQRLVQLAGAYMQGVLTWVPTARFEGERYAYIGAAGSDVVGKVYAEQNGAGTRQVVNLGGKRLPYAPEATYTLALGYRGNETLDLRLEVQGTSRQFGDAANTTVTVADGQQGIIEGYTIWNASAMYRIAPTRTALFATVKNIGDQLYIADRTRGLLPGLPRTIHVGVAQSF